MKTIKLTFLLGLALCLTINFSQAQKSYQIHQDNVNPSMVMQYEKVAKEFNDACNEHKPQTSWVTAVTNDMKYLYISPIENMADLDKQPFADMAKKMGDKWTKMFEDFDKCYNSHRSYVIHLVEDLTYMPEGISMTQDGQNYRKWFYIYFTPSNAAKVREGMKAVKDLYTTKGSKEFYRVYRNGFGTSEDFYLVAVSAKDEIDGATKSKENDAVLGPDSWDTFSKVMNYASRFEEYSGEMRPDLAYAPK
ncbi:hypothetical protein CJ739_3538 [Mariniflexile rhizosphaerae]|uniref:hypothetical protein n=1 Tax=unclassified Mariniflexile TaxID=2643887 RepID=UPI000CB8892B|nr:hypothetical protein [Mariniflexile sp. TRM1-10]AXP82600.1 hypothetical protein CJ739_3538 [Mariniflexile sp. TRM1-10]PLB19611.1 MAG: hypothetical protein TRG1_1660 [Flavobacteriaceae bacterium FS1-H7996/R]